MASNQSLNYDIIIVGGGLAGLSMALALTPLNLSIALVDQQAVNDDEPMMAYDDRSVALSYGTRQIFKGMGIWSDIAPFAQAIQHIHISDKGSFGATRLEASKLGVEALGYTIENKILGHRLYQQLKQTTVSILSPFKVKQLSYQHDRAVLTAEPITEQSASSDANKASSHSQSSTANSSPEDQLSTSQNQPTSMQFSAKLIIAADGSQSALRDLAGIGVSRKPYEQSAIIANVSTQQAHQGRAFERFTNQGPLAFLPLPKQRCSLVWTLEQDNADAYMALSDDDFMRQLQDTFGYRLGNVTQIGQRSCFPLALMQAQHNHSQRIALIGNASHTLHPVAGQGLNLGIRDIAVLAEIIKQQQLEHNDIGDYSALADYSAQRSADHARTIHFTDGLIQLFSQDSPWLAHLRGAGLVSLDRVPPLKQALAKQSMGLTLGSTRLGRGLALLKVGKE